VAKSPNEVWAHTLIAMSLHLQNRIPEARQRYEKILAIDPRAAIAANNLATLMADEGQNLDKALDLAQTAKQQLPDSPEVSDTLGSVYLRKGLSSMALPAFEFSARTDPANPVYQYHLGMTYEKMGDKVKARTALQRALALQPDFEGASDARRLLSAL
jgi:Flp pilus assembly protein TadD